MISNLALTADQVKKAVKAAIECKPEFAGMLDFYGRIFVAQEESKHHHRIEPPKIADDIRAIRAREKFPMIEIKDFVYDNNEACKLFVLICSFCWHCWPVKRIFCPFCETSDNRFLHYLFGEEEKHIRVDLCDNCNRYLKTIDIRRADRPIYPPLEQMATLHLDFKAKEEGFDPGVRLFMDV